MQNTLKYKFNAEFFYNTNGSIICTVKETDPQNNPA